MFNSLQYIIVYMSNIEDIIYNKITSIKLNSSVNTCTSCTIKIHILPEIELMSVDIPNKINVLLPFGKFKFIIIKTQYHISTNEITLVCKHKSFLMLQSRDYNFFMKSTPKKIIQNICDEYKQNYSKIDFIINEEYELYTQFNETYENFLHRICNENSSNWICNQDDSIQVGSLDSIKEKNDHLFNCISNFIYHKSTYGSLTQLWNYDPDNTNEVKIEKIENAHDLYTNSNIYVPFSTTKMHEYGQKYKDKPSFISGDILFHVPNQIHLGSIIEYNDKDFIISSYEYSESNNIVPCIRFIAQDILDTPTYIYPIIHPIRGYIRTESSETKTKIDDKSRVFVELVLDKKKQMIPVKHIQKFTTEDISSWTLPTENNEVIINFIDNDCNQPIVIGSIYNNTNTVTMDNPETSVVIASVLGKEGNYSTIAINYKKDQECVLIESSGEVKVNSQSNLLICIDGEDTKNALNIEHGDYDIVITKGDMTWTLDKGNISIKCKSLTIESEETDINTEKTINLTAETINLKAEKLVSIESKDITFTSDNITSTASKDIKSEANNISNTAKLDLKNEALNISNKATVDLKNEGLNISNKAQVEIKSEGLMISTKAITALKLEGLMIDINAQVMIKLQAIIADNKGLGMFMINSATIVLPDGTIVSPRALIADGVMRIGIPS